eukprot:TRINITY_DN4088_c0_g1_i1.p1 TRINITY_DN4088_c0_g1~~TRINITY_DN4088_c0_g1_i1.p1  ORF type:complete len:305 (-),score=74.55 TRINITY_DN4088_c0_g1_i1:95-1009(-)
MAEYTGYAHSDPKADAAALHKAFKGAGTDEDVVIAILAHRSKQQIEQIDHEYRIQSSNGTSLQHALEKELSGSFRELAVGLATPVIEFKKRALKDAVEGLGTRESTVIDVVTQSSNDELREISKDADLYKKVLSDVSGDFKTVVVTLFRGERPHGPTSQAQAEELAQAFYKAGEGKIGTDEKKYIDIITKHSYEALQQINEIYKKNHKHGLIPAVESETSGDLKRSLISLLKTKEEHFADRLHDAIAGLGTDERVLIYVFSIFDKATLHKIGDIYKAKYKESLKDAIKGDTSYNFGKMLLALLE